MNEHETMMSEKIAQAASIHQKALSGHAPASVDVILSADTLVITLYDALTPAEKALALSPEGANQVQEFHRQLFLSSAQPLRDEIRRITGRDVREAAAEVVVPHRAVVHAFASGNIVQVHTLEAGEKANAQSGV